MLLLTFLILVVLSVGMWLFTPLIHALTPLLSMAWLGWGLLALGLWLMAGEAAEPRPPRRKD